MASLRLLVLSFMMVLTIARVLSLRGSHSLPDEKLLGGVFEEWMVRFGKSYGGDAREKQARLEIFKANTEYVRGHNERKSSLYALELNAFADLTKEEAKASPTVGRLLFNKLEERARAQDTPLPACNTSALPSSFDWRQHGVVTPVKDQGLCGSCWAFAAVATMESAYAISTGKLLSLSEQELVSCVVNDTGCGGGFMDDAFTWVADNGGIDSEGDYPYVSGEEGTPACDETKASHNKVAKFTSFVDVPKDDEVALLCSVAQQPVTVAIDASVDFQLYMNGIFDGGSYCPSEFEDLDHAITFVGWGSTNGVDYWIAKNSWGPSWGMQGYVYIKRNGHNKRGVCGVNYMPSFPVV